jgi:hypothetical protein
MSICVVPRTQTTNPAQAIGFKEVLGQHTWFLLHALAEAASDKVEDSSRNALDAVFAVLKAYPCSTCSEQFEKHHAGWFYKKADVLFNAKALNETVPTATRLKLLLVELHNRVNTTCANKSDSAWDIDVGEKNILKKLNAKYAAHCH